MGVFRRAWIAFWAAMDSLLEQRIRRFFMAMFMCIVFCTVMVKMGIKAGIRNVPGYGWTTCLAIGFACSMVVFPLYRCALVRTVFLIIIAFAVGETIIPAIEIATENDPEALSKALVLLYCVVFTLLLCVILIHKLELTTKKILIAMLASNMLHCVFFGPVTMDIVFYYLLAHDFSLAIRRFAPGRPDIVKHTIFELIYVSRIFLHLLGRETSLLPQT